MAFIKQPFDEFLGFEYERTAADRVLVRLPLRAIHMNSVGVVHGGVISTLVDVTMSNLIEADENGVQRAVTVDLHTTFVTGAKGTELVAKAEIVKQGRAMMYADCRVFDAKNHVVARATGSFVMRRTGN